MTTASVAAAEIVADVRERGAVAVDEWAIRIDGVAAAPACADGAAVPSRELRRLAERVRRWHALQRPRNACLEVEPGVELERRWLPLDSVGVYVPRGLLSTLVMCVVPAQVAGVERIVVATPPQGADAVAAAARELGVGDVWAIGGAQAIAWLAYVERVAKVVGPGNAFVNDAKLLVSRDVAIDLPAGPSEVAVVLSDESLRPLAELELAAQAEHGTDAVCTLLEYGHGTLATLDELAPEHVVLLGREAEQLAPRIRNAGATFVGPSSSVPLGDYATGGNHVLPTGGWARSSGGLGLETFLKPVVTQRITRRGLERLRPTVEALADAEGLTAHVAAVRR